MLPALSKETATELEKLKLADSVSKLQAGKDYLVRLGSILRRGKPQVCSEIFGKRNDIANALNCSAVELPFPHDHAENGFDFILRKN